MTASNNRAYKKVKITLNRPLRPKGGVKVFLYSFFNLGARQGPVNATPRPLHSRKRRLGEPQGRSARVREMSFTPRFDPLTVQPVESRYTGSQSGGVLYYLLHRFLDDQQRQRHESAIRNQPTVALRQNRNLIWWMSGNLLWWYKKVTE